MSASTTLAALKPIGAKKPNQILQVVQRRNKVAKRVWQPIELAKAQEQGTHVSVKQ
jgi:hypothetical protein